MMVRWRGVFGLVWCGLVHAAPHDVCNLLKNSNKNGWHGLCMEEAVNFFF
jgi:hypothetical protein